MIEPTTTNQQELSVSSSPLKRHPLVAYFLFAYALAWLLWLPLVLSTGGGLGLLPFTTAPTMNGLNLTLILLGSCSPTVAAIIMSAVTGGWVSVRQLLRRVVQVRESPSWYLIAFAVPLLVSILTALILNSTTLLPLLFSGQVTYGLIFYIFAALINMLLSSALTEEPGWRGFALPRLQQDHGPLLGSLILGVLWALWYLPLFFTPWGKGYDSTGILLGLLLFTLTTLGYTFLMTWVFNNTRGSIFITILLHSATDSVGVFFAAFDAKALARLNQQTSAAIGLIASTVLWLVVAAIVILYTKGRLSYTPETEPSQP